MRKTCFITVIQFSFHSYKWYNFFKILFFSFIFDFRFYNYSLSSKYNIFILFLILQTNYWLQTHSWLPVYIIEKITVSIYSKNRSFRKWTKHITREWIASSCVYILKFAEMSIKIHWKKTWRLPYFQTKCLKWYLKKRNNY